MFGCELLHSMFVHADVALLQHEVDEVQRETQVPVQGPGHSSWRTKQADTQVSGFKARPRRFFLAQIFEIYKSEVYVEEIKKFLDE